MLRTVMLSTRADRYYGPPDGIQPEFDLLSRLNHFRDRAAYCIGLFIPRLKSNALNAGGNAAGTRTIHHNSSSRKTSVTHFYEHDFKIYQQANRVPDSCSIAHRKTCAAHHFSLDGENYAARSCRAAANLLHVPASSSRPLGLQSFQHLFRLVPCAPSDSSRCRHSSSSPPSAIELFSAAMAAGEVQKVDITPAKPNRTISFRDRLVVGLEARLKSEVDFVDAVVAEVQNGHLPQRLVDETFFWARQRASFAVNRDGRNRRPIIYFQPAMRARANLLHVTL